MSHESKYVTQSGIDVFNGTLIPNQTLSYILTSDDSPVGFGKTVTPEAAVKMIKDQIFENVQEIISRADNNVKTEAELKQIIITEFSEKRIATEFGKESLLRILSQENCVGIRFTTCKSISGRSIVAIGLTQEVNDEKKTISVPLKKDFFNDKKAQSADDPELRPLAEEEGVGKTTKSILEDMGNSLEDFVTKLKLDNKDSIERFSKDITTNFLGFK